MPIEPRLEERLLRWVESCERGLPLSAEELCTDCPELLAELRRRIEGLQKLAPIAGGTDDELTGLSAVEGEAVAPADRGAPAEPHRADGPRYRVLRFHAQGGLGEVHVAQDGEFPRQVALKRIQSRHAHDRVIRQRFLREAQAKGARANSRTKQHWPLSLPGAGSFAPPSAFRPTGQPGS